MLKLLVLILVILLYAIGRERGIVTFVSLCFNIAALSASIIMMSWGWDPVAVTIMSCFVICYVTLFYQNGKNSKTFSSFFSVAAVLFILFAISCFIGYRSHSGGINEIMQLEDEITRYAPDINIDMSKIAVSMILTGLIGAAMDASIAVASAVYEVYKNNRNLSIMELYQSGISIGGDILGTTMNTLYFACLGESLSLFILLKNYQYSVLDMINSKAFFQEFTDVTISCIGCILVIPLTAISIAYVIKNLSQFERFLPDEELLLELDEQIEKEDDQRTRFSNY